MFELLMLLGFLYAGLVHLLPADESGNEEEEGGGTRQARRDGPQPAARGRDLNRPRRPDAADGRRTGSCGDGAAAPIRLRN